MARVKLTINGKELSVPEGTTILEAARQAGAEIPTLCHVAELKNFTSCFMCVVTVEGAPKPVPSCSTLVTDGIVVHHRQPGHPPDPAHLPGPAALGSHRRLLCALPSHLPYRHRHSGIPER